MYLLHATNTSHTTVAWIVVAIAQDIVWHVKDVGCNYELRMVGKTLA